jgi:hypothetical protein
MDKDGALEIVGVAEGLLEKEGGVEVEGISDGRLLAVMEGRLDGSSLGVGLGTLL